MEQSDGIRELIVRRKSWQAAQQLADQVLKLADFGQTVELIGQQTFRSEEVDSVSVIISCPEGMVHLIENIIERQRANPAVGLEELLSYPLEWGSLVEYDQQVEQFNGSITIGQIEV